MKAIDKILARIENEENEILLNQIVGVEEESILYEDRTQSKREFGEGWNDEFIPLEELPDGELPF